MTYILGISAFYHDSAAALIKDGVVISAIQEERLSRIKHDQKFPTNAINKILEINNISLDEISYVCFYDKPFLKFERLLETYISYAPKGFNSFRKAMPLWMKEKLFQKEMIKKELKAINSNFNLEIFFCEHHLSHAASAFFPSPFDDAIILTADGVGEWASTTISIGKKNDIKIVEEIHYPHSIGLIYSAFTGYLGFKVNSGEYKVMGLAPYGKPKYKDIILNNLVDLKEDGSFKLNQKYFNYSTGLTMVNKKFEDLFGKKTRISETDEIDQFHMDIAASIQEVTELIMLNIVKYISKKYSVDNLCLAGGVALNCVANSKILNSKLFKNIWIQPAAGDAGGAIGSALSIWYQELNNERKENKSDLMKGSYLGPAYSDAEIEDSLAELGANFSKLDYEKLIDKTADLISKGNTIGWFQGKMEFGPRALGNRSILADPRSEKMQKNLNLKIKFRESFRPFAPAILDEEKSNWFEMDTVSPYMLFVSNLKNEKRINISKKDLDSEGFDLLKINRTVVPAITHVDYSARVQTVHKETNSKFHDLIKSFQFITDCPMLVNTSFNIRGEPIVCSPVDAYRCFMGTDLDYLIIENYILSKDEQESSGSFSYKETFNLD
jgi:carbamoyltransferase